MKRAMIVVGIFVTLCLMSTVAQAIDFHKYAVKFVAKQNEGELSVFSGNKGCNKGQGNKKGCINFPEDSIGLIKFYMGPEKQIRTCSDPSTKWVISKVELSDHGYRVVDETDSNKTKVSDKGIFETSHLPHQKYLEDIFPQYDQSTGFLYVAPTPLEGVSQVTILNLNNNDNADGVKDIWYRVSAAKCGSDPVEVLISDPRLENEGHK